VLHTSHHINEPKLKASWHKVCLRGLTIINPLHGRSPHRMLSSQLWFLDAHMALSGRYSVYYHVSYDLGSRKLGNTRRSNRIFLGTIGKYWDNPSRDWDKGARFASAHQSIFDCSKHFSALIRVICLNMSDKYIFVPRASVGAHRGRSSAPAKGNKVPFKFATAMASHFQYID
jgi:hypothetical protein